MAEVEAALMAGLERADAEGQPVHEVAEMMARGAEITAEINGNELIITAEESDTMESILQSDASHAGSGHVVVF